MFYRPDLIQIYLMVLVILLSLSYCEKSTITNNNARHKSSHYKGNLKSFLTKRKFSQNNIKSKYDEQALLQDQTKSHSSRIQNPYSQLNNKELATTNVNLNINNKYKHKWKREEDYSEDVKNLEMGDIEDITTPNTKELLIEIFDELQQIHQNSSFHKKKTPCLLNGTWVSDIIGIAFNISIPSDGPTGIKPIPTCRKDGKEEPINLNATIGCVKLNTFEVKPDEKIKYEPILNHKWNITARIPFSRLTMLVITGEHTPTNSVAIFVGQCKYCDKKELVIGQWMVHKYTKECRKVQIYEDVFGDVLRRRN